MNSIKDKTIKHCECREVAYVSDICIICDLMDENKKLHEQVGELEKLAESWMQDYDRLKAKYEPSVATTAATPVGKNSLE